MEYRDKASITTIQIWNYETKNLKLNLDEIKQSTNTIIDKK